MSFGHLGEQLFDTVGLLGLTPTRQDNILEAIGEIQLHTIDNVLKNWTDRIGYCMPSRESPFIEIIFHY